MKTKGINCVRAKNGILLFLFALIASLPVLSQVSFISSTNTSFFDQGKKFASLVQDYYAVSGTAEREYRAASTTSVSAATVKNFSKEEKIITGGTSTTKNNIIIIGENKEIAPENMKISFKPTSFTYPENSRIDIGITKYSADQLILYARVLKQYAKKNGFDTNYAFLSNMGMRSNKKRFFVINLNTMEIEQAGLVAHGRGQGPSVFDKQYSNQTGSKCTSLGRYKISGKYKGGYGEAYKMVGLDSSNKNAYSRNIVLHSMGCIPDIDGVMPACVSEGCPAVSTRFLTSLRKIIDSRKKPVLLWIFDSNLQEAVVEDRFAANNKETKNTPLNKQHKCAVHHHEEEYTY